MSGSGVLATSGGKVVGLLETDNNILDNGSGAATIAGSLTVVENTTIQGALNVSGTVDAPAVNAPSMTNAGILLNGNGPTTPFFSGDQGAAITWNLDPPTVSGGSWNVGLGGGEFVLVNQYGGGVGGYGFWDGPDGGPFKLLATISGAGTANPGYTTISGGLQTKENTLDDGSGNANILGNTTINGTLEAGELSTRGSVNGNTLNISNGGSIDSGQTSPSATPALTLSGNGQQFLFVPDIIAESYNPIVESGDLVITGYSSVSGGSNIDIVPWTSTKSGIRLQGNGNVSTANNVLDNGSGNATISGALSSNIAIPGGNNVALNTAISQLSVNVNNFSSPQAAVDYVISQGGGEVFFPASATEYSGFVANYPYNLRIVGQGFGSRISGDVVFNNNYTITTSSAVSSSTSIPVTSVSGLQNGFYIQSYDLPSGNSVPQSTYITSIDSSTNTITVNNSVTLVSGQSLEVMNPNFPQNNIQIENICLNIMSGTALNMITFNKVYFLNTGGNSLYINTVKNLTVENCYFATTSYNSNQHIFVDNIFGAGVLSGNVNILNNNVLTGYRNSSSPDGGMAVFIILNHTETSLIHGNKCDWGFWGSGANSPMSFIILNGQCQGHIISKNFMSGISSFLTLNSRTENGTTYMPSYIDIVDDNQVDVYVDVLINVNNASNPAAYIVVDGNSFDNPMYYVTGIASIAAGGSGYAVGNTVTLGNSLGGAEGFSAQATVTSVSSGAITGLSLSVQGAYPAPLSNPVAVSGGSGSGATVNLNWSGNPNVAWFNNTYLAQFTNNRVFTYGGYNPNFPAVVFNSCNVTRFNGNSIETFVVPVEYQGGIYNEIRGNLLSGIAWGSGMESGSPPSGSTAIAIYGGGSYSDVSAFQIGENDIFAFDYAGLVFDGSGNNTGVQYINILGDNVIGNILNDTQFFYNGNNVSETWTTSLDYEEHWSPATFQQNVTFNEAVALGSGSILTVGGNATLSGASYFDGPIYFYNSVVGSPSIQTAPTVSVGTFTQNNSGGPLWLCLPVILGSNASANLYISSASSGAADVDVSNFNNGNSADMVATLSGLVPAGWWWVVSASGSYTVNSSSYPNGAVRII